MGGGRHLGGGFAANRAYEYDSLCCVLSVQRDSDDVWESNKNAAKNEDDCWGGVQQQRGLCWRFGVWRGGMGKGDEQRDVSRALHAVRRAFASLHDEEVQRYLPFLICIFVLLNETHSFLCREGTTQHPAGQMQGD